MICDPVDMTDSYQLMLVKDGEEKMMRKQRLLMLFVVVVV